MPILMKRAVVSNSLLTYGYGQSGLKRRRQRSNRRSRISGDDAVSLIAFQTIEKLFLRLSESLKTRMK
jgi:hypothetical protein